MRYRSSRRADPGRTACRKARRSPAPRPSNPGWVVTSRTRSPPSQTSRSCSRKPARYCFPLRAPIHALPTGETALRLRQPRAHDQQSKATFLRTRAVRVDSAARLAQDALEFTGEGHEMPETPTFGRYAENPYDQMTPEQQEAYRSLMGTRGQIGGPSKIWVHNPKLAKAAGPFGAHFQRGQYSLSERERELRCASSPANGTPLIRPTRMNGAARTSDCRPTRSRRCCPVCRPRSPIRARATHEKTDERRL